MAIFQNTQQAIWPLPETLDPEFESKVHNFEFYTLSNGLRVLQTSDPNDRSFNVKVQVNGGAIHQEVGKRGIPHFHEHMVFKGTEKFADKKDLYEFAENFNLSHNASTGYTDQEFYANSDADLESANAACEFVSQVVFHPSFPETEALLEREVVLSERLMYNNEPWDVVGELYARHYFEEQHPLGGGGVLGSEDEIKEFTVQDVRDFHDKFFHPANMLLVISSQLEGGKMRELAEKYFNVTKPGEWNPNPIIGLKRATQKESSLIEKDYDATYVYVNHYFPEERIGQMDKEIYTMILLSYVLSKRLYKDLRDSQGLAYAIGSYSDSIYHGRNLVLYGQFGKDKYKKAKEQLVTYVNKLVEEPITEMEFKRAMRNRKSVRWADSPSKILDFIADKYFYRGQFVSPEYTHRYYDQVSLGDLQAFAKDYLKDNQPEIVAVGPVV
jgi:predicted Zn-dependent peptidase